MILTFKEYHLVYLMHEGLNIGKIKSLLEIDQFKNVKKQLLHKFDAVNDISIMRKSIHMNCLLKEDFISSEVKKFTEDFVTNINYDDFMNEDENSKKSFIIKILLNYYDQCIVNSYDLIKSENKQIRFSKMEKKILTSFLLEESIDTIQRKTSYSEKKIKAAKSRIKAKLKTIYDIQILSKVLGLNVIPKFIDAQILLDITHMTSDKILNDLDSSRIENSTKNVMLKKIQLLTVYNNLLDFYWELMFRYFSSKEYISSTTLNG